MSTALFGSQRGEGEGGHRRTETACGRPTYHIIRKPDAKTISHRTRKGTKHKRHPRLHNNNTLKNKSYLDKHNLVPKEAKKGAYVVEETKEGVAVKPLEIAAKPGHLDRVGGQQRWDGRRRGPRSPSVQRRHRVGVEDPHPRLVKDLATASKRGNNEGCGRGLECGCVGAEVRTTWKPCDLECASVRDT